jgi:hypothetical protein
MLEVPGKAYHGKCTSLFFWQVNISFLTLPLGFVARVASNQRNYDSSFDGGDIFSTNPKTYDAYDEDVAVVQVGLS